MTGAATGLAMALLAHGAAFAQAAEPAQANPPIITDQAFDAALPPLDAAPPTQVKTQAPQTQASQTQAPQTQAPPTPEQPAEPDALPPVGASDDPDLTAPLPPLQGYDVQPQQAAAPAEAAPEIRYVTQVAGLKAAGVAAEFKALSALENGKGRAANVAMVRARASEDEALILRLLNSRGYFDGAVTTTLKSAPDANGPVTASLVAVPGPLYRFDLIRIDANPTQPPDLIRNALPLAQGDPILADAVLAAEASVSVGMQENGYPFAKIGARDIDPQEQELLREHKIHVFTMTDIDQRGMSEVMQETIAIASQARHGVHLSLDMDSLDPRDAPGVGTPVKGGLTYREAHLAMEVIAASKRLVSMDVVEVNPILDRENATAHLAVELVLSALGKKII